MNEMDLSQLLYFGKRLLIGYQAKSREIIPEDYPALCKVTTTEPGRSYSIFELKLQGFPRYMVVNQQICAKVAIFKRKVENDPKYAHFSVKGNIILKPGDVIEYLDIIPKHKYVHVSCKRFEGKEVFIPYDASGTLQWYQDPNEYTLKEVFTRYRPDLHSINVKFDDGLNLIFGQDLRVSKTLLLYIHEDFRNKVILLPTEESHTNIHDTYFEGLDFTINILNAMWIQNGGRMHNVYQMDVTPDTNRRIREMVDGEFNMIICPPIPLLATHLNTIRRCQCQGRVRSASEPVLNPPPKMDSLRRTNAIKRRKHEPSINYDLIDLDGKSDEGIWQCISAPCGAAAHIFSTTAARAGPNVNNNATELTNRLRQINNPFIDSSYQLRSGSTQLESVDLPPLMNLLRKALGSESDPLPETGPHLAFQTLAQGLQNFTENEVFKGTSSAGGCQGISEALLFETYADIPKDVSNLSVDQLAQCFEVANLPGAAKYCRKIHVSGKDFVDFEDDEMNIFAKNSGEIKRCLEKIQKGER